MRTNPLRSSEHRPAHLPLCVVLVDSVAGTAREDDRREMIGDEQQVTERLLPNSLFAHAPHKANSDAVMFYEEVGELLTLACHQRRDHRLMFGHRRFPSSLDAMRQ